VSPTNPALTAALDAAVAQVAAWPVDRAAVAVLRLGPSVGPLVGGSVGGSIRPEAGPAEVVATTGAVDLPFRWASVTKPATALATLIAVEEGTVSLDQPAGPPGSTVRHLLAHASGLGPEGGVLAAPGHRRIYSNAGYQLLAELLADGSGLTFDEYLGGGVLVPLGMTATTLDPGATGGPGAAGLAGPVLDLAALAAEWARPTLISAATHRTAVSVHFPGLAGVLPGFGAFDPCDWGLGVEIRGTKQPHWTGATNSPATVGHFGQSGSFLWVDPVAGLACVGLADRRFGPWAARAWPTLADAVLATVAEHLPLR
jgi:CubicO group peptidase (beta-lactamase class C family)